MIKKKNWFEWKASLEENNLNFIMRLSKIMYIHYSFSLKDKISFQYGLAVSLAKCSKFNNRIGRP